MTLKEAKQLCEQRTVLKDLQEKYPFRDTNPDPSLLKLQESILLSIELAN